MKWQRIKGAGEIVLDGIKIELETHDGSPKAIELADAKGGRVKVCLSNYSDFAVMVPAKPETKDAYLLKGEFRGLPVKELFEHDFEARQRLREITDGHDDGALKIEKVKAPVTEAGELPVGAEIPF